MTKPDYATNDPKGWAGDPSRGAALGRSDRHTARDEVLADELGKFTLRRVYLDAGGYDGRGAYWGHGAPLYWYASECGRVDATLRASSRVAAKAIVRELYPTARFYR